jgi:4-hydroxybenzoate polyprenyltransferase
MNFKKLIRLSDWKNYIIPFLSGAIFISVYLNEIPFIRALKFTGLLLASIIGIAAYGYLLNNLYDLEEDRRAGKINLML